MQTKLYFVVTYIYGVDPKGGSFLTQENKVEFFPSEKMGVVMEKIKEKEEFCYHRNIGGNWHLIPDVY